MSFATPTRRLSGAAFVAAALFLAFGSVQGDDIVDEILRKQRERQEKEAAERAKEGEKQPDKPEGGSPLIRSDLPAPPPTDEPEAVAPKDGIVLTGRRVLMADICEASWCPSAAQPIEKDKPIEVAGIRISRDDRQVNITGFVRESKPSRRLQPYRPRAFKLPEDPAAPAPDTSIRLRGLERGVDLEICGADGNGLVVIRIEQTWRGVVWGPLTAWEFELEKEKLYVVDADLDGHLSTDDRMVYGSRSIWMPWHTVTLSGDTIYHEISDANSYQLTALTRKLDPRGVDSAVWDRWQETRKDHGVPPGLFSAELQKHCESHAEYCRLNNHRGHDQDPNKPGYSAEGHAAGTSSCISYRGREGAMQRFLDSLYHRPQLIDPRDVGLQLGGTANTYLMGFGLGSDLPSELRSLEQGQVYPAPGSRVPGGIYTVENPRHPVLNLSDSPGLPVTVRLPDFDPRFSKVDCWLYRVRGDMRTGQRSDEVGCHLSHAGKDAPAGFPAMWSMVALTPLAALSKGNYEADFVFTIGGKEHRYNWRFEVG